MFFFFILFFFFIFILFFIEIPISKQCRPRSDAAERPKNGTPGLYGLKGEWLILWILRNDNGLTIKWLLSYVRVMLGLSHEVGVYFFLCVFFFFFFSQTTFSNYSIILGSSILLLKISGSFTIKDQIPNITRGWSRANKEWMQIVLMPKRQRTLWPSFLVIWYNTRMGKRNLTPWIFLSEILRACFKYLFCFVVVFFLLFCWLCVFTTGRFIWSLTLLFVLMGFLVLLSIVITSHGEEKAGLCASRAVVCLSCNCMR